MAQIAIMCNSVSPHEIVITDNYSEEPQTITCFHQDFRDIIENIFSKNEFDAVFLTGNELIVSKVKEDILKYTNCKKENIFII